MTFYLNTQDTDWPAQERLCRDLGVAHSSIEGNGRAFQLGRVALSFLAMKPWGLFRLFYVLDDYWDFKLQLRILEKEAQRYDSSRNRGMIDHIILQAGQNLIREPSKHWPELIGLYCQKLAHLRYYDEFATKEPAD